MSLQFMLLPAKQCVSEENNVWSLKIKCEVYCNDEFYYKSKDFTIARFRVFHWCILKKKQTTNNNQNICVWTWLSDFNQLSDYAVQAHILCIYVCIYTYTHAYLCACVCACWSTVVTCLWQVTSENILDIPILCILLTTESSWQSVYLGPCLPLTSNEHWIWFHYFYRGKTKNSGKKTSYTAA